MEYVRITPISERDYLFPTCNSAQFAGQRRSYGDALGTSGAVDQELWVRFVHEQWTEGRVALDAEQRVMQTLAATAEDAFTVEARDGNWRVWSYVSSNFQFAQAFFSKSAGFPR